MVHPSPPRPPATEAITTRPLTTCLILLIVADTILTYVAVGHLGAQELNPLPWLAGGLHGFLAIKAAASMICVGGLHHLGKQYRKRMRACSAVLCVLYAGALAWNLGGLLGVVVVT